MGYLDLTNADVFALTRQRRIEAIAEKRAHLFGKYGPTIYGVRAVIDFKAARAAAEDAKAKEKRLSSRARYRSERRTIRDKRCGSLMWAQGGLCYLCAAPFSEDMPPTLDHVMPRSGGGRDYGNLLLACEPCNNRKGARMPTRRESAILRLVNVALERQREDRSTYVAAAFEQYG